MWGQKVWVHDPNNSKLGGRAKEGGWMGFNTESWASRIYWLDKTKVSIERNVKFDEDMTQLISVTQPTDTHASPATGTTESTQVIPDPLNQCPGKQTS